MKKGSRFGGHTAAAPSSSSGAAAAVSSSDAGGVAASDPSSASGDKPTASSSAETKSALEEFEKLMECVRRLANGEGGAAVEGAAGCSEDAVVAAGATALLDEDLMTQQQYLGTVLYTMRYLVAIIS